MRVLVVEDDPDVGGFVRQGLREHGFAVDWVANGVEGLDYANSGVYDVLVLDRMLPGLDGLDLLRRLRGKGVTTPVLFLSARTAVADRIEGLDAGADDYLIKPFSFAELLARIRVVLRRGLDVPPAVLQVADLRLDPAARVVERAGRRIDLSSKQFALLEYLMRHAGQVVSRTMILEHVWDFDFDGLTNVVDVHINRLRNKVDRDFDRPLIQTLRGVGYVVREE
jgi:two-component system, OmpR family, response regulator